MANRGYNIGTWYRRQRLFSVRGAGDRVEVASQWQLMWWKFRKHKPAMIGGIVTILVYLVAIFAEFLAPFDTDALVPSIHMRHPLTTSF